MHLQKLTADEVERLEIPAAAPLFCRLDDQGELLDIRSDSA